MKMSLKNYSNYSTRLKTLNLVSFLILCLPLPGHLSEALIAFSKCLYLIRSTIFL